MQFFSTILAQFVHRLRCFENEVYFFNYLGASVIFLINKRNSDHFQNHIRIFVDLFIIKITNNFRNIPCILS